jgi:hypothetical protein
MSYMPSHVCLHMSAFTCLHMSCMPSLCIHLHSTVASCSLLSHSSHAFSWGGGGGAPQGALHSFTIVQRHSHKYIHTHHEGSSEGSLIFAIHRENADPCLERLPGERKRERWREILCLDGGSLRGSNELRDPLP